MRYQVWQWRNKLNVKPTRPEAATLLVGLPCLPPRRLDRLRHSEARAWHEALNQDGDAIIHSNQTYQKTFYVGKKLDLLLLCFVLCLYLLLAYAFAATTQGPEAECRQKAGRRDPHYFESISR